MDNEFTGEGMSGGYLCGARGAAVQGAAFSEKRAAGGRVNRTVLENETVKHILLGGERTRKVSYGKLGVLWGAYNTTATEKPLIRCIHNRGYCERGN